MKVWWIQFGNSEVGRQRFKVPRLDYPLAFNLPPTSWQSDHAQIILPNTKSELELHLDLVFEMRKNLSAQSESIDESWIEGYRWGLGCFDRSLVGKFLNPSTREKGVCDYYGRWHVKSNSVSSLWKGQESLQDFGKVDVKIDTLEIARDVQFDLNCLEILNFFKEFNSFTKGDLISLGTVCVIPLQDAFPVKMNLKWQARECEFQILRAESHE